MAELVVRPLRTDDRAAWQPLWEGYLRFYREDDLDPAVTDASFARLCAGDDRTFALLAERDNTACGLAHAVLHASTWRSHPVTYLEDLFVTPDARGTGAGRTLIEAVYARADELGAPHVYWRTQAFNGRARSLYDQVGRLQSDVVYER